MSAMKKYKINKTYQEINKKIRSGEVVVVTADEIIDIVKDEGPVEAARRHGIAANGCARSFRFHHCNAVLNRARSGRAMRSWLATSQTTLMEQGDR